MKRYNNLFLLFSVALLVLVFASCAHELGGDLPMPSEGDVRIRFTLSNTPVAAATRAATEEGDEALGENRITNLKLFLYDGEVNESSSKLKFFKSINSDTPEADPEVRWNTSNGTLVIKAGAIDRTKKYFIVVMANWDASNGFNAGNFVVDTSVYTDFASYFSRISAPIGTPLVTPFLMSGFVVGDFTQQTTVTVNLERQVAKLRFKIKLNKNFVDAFSGIKFGNEVEPTGSQLTTYNIPNSSFVLNKGNIASLFPSLMSKPGSSYFDYPTQPLIEQQTGSYQETKEWTLMQYVFENQPEGFGISDDEKKKKITTFILRMPYKIGSEATVYNNYYKFYIEDKAEAGESPSIRQKTVRNHLYDVAITVNGFGGEVPAIDGATVTTTVNEWENINMEIDNAPKYFNITRTKIEFKAGETKQEVVISTDVKDWKLVDSGGTTIFSYDEGKTGGYVNGILTYAIRGTAPASTITITRTSNDPFVKQTMTFIAQNIRVPLTVY